MGEREIRSCQFLFRIIRAANTPGTQPHKVRIKTIKTEPQPWSMTDRGGKRMAKSTLRKDMVYWLVFFVKKVFSMQK